MAHTSTSISAPVRLTQDIWPVLGRTGRLGEVISRGHINPWSRHKPFRSTSPAFSTNDGVSGTWLSDKKKAEEHAAYGFIETPLASPTKSQMPGVVYDFDRNFLRHSAYKYFKPNGTPYWFREKDFDGYSTRAVPPMAFSCESMYGDAQNGAIIYIDNLVSGWNADTCLRISDVAHTLAGYPVGLLLTVDGQETVYFLSSGLDIDHLNSSGVGYIFLFSGVSADYVCPLLNSGWLGRNVTAAVIIAPGQYGSTGAFADAGTYELTASGCRFLPKGSTDYPENWRTVQVTKSALLGEGQSNSLELTYGLGRATVMCKKDDTGVDMSKISVSKSADIYYGGTGENEDWRWYNQLGTGNARFTINVGDGFYSGGAKRIYMTAQYNVPSGGLSDNNTSINPERAGQFRIPQSGNLGQGFDASDNHSYPFSFNFLPTDYLLMYKSAGVFIVSCTVRVALDQAMTQGVREFTIEFDMTNQ